MDFNQVVYQIYPLSVEHQKKMMVFYPIAF